MIKNAMNDAMTLAMNDLRLAKPGTQNAALRDYDSVRRAIAFISERWRTQPTIEAMADAASLTPDELHHLFRRWAGLTPKGFMQALTLDHAKNLLRDSASVLDAALDSGLSGPGRLHDLFVTHEAMSPGEWKAGGAGMIMRYGFHPSPFGTALVIATDRGLAGLAFADAAERDLYRGLSCDGAIGPAHLRQETVAGGSAVARDLDWHRLRGAGLGDAAEDPDGPRGLLLGYRQKDRVTEGLARSGCCGRQEPDLLRGALPSRAGKKRRADRLSLGPHPQAGDDGLGSRTGRSELTCCSGLMVRDAQSSCAPHHEGLTPALDLILRSGASPRLEG
jgi:AraC-like DNA-binding protein